jgi:curved DNA-binding protein CbpA
MQIFLISTRNGNLKKSSSFKNKIFIYASPNFLRKNFSSMSQNILYNPDLDYYMILKVSPQAEVSEIKKAFYSLSIKHHPDKGGKEDDFKNINNAYEILKSPEDRKIYDKLRQEYKEDLESRLQDKHRKKENNYEERKEYNYHYRKHDRDFYKEQAEWTKRYHNHEEKKYSKKAGSNNQQNYNGHDDAYQNYEWRENFKNQSDYESELNRRYKEFLEMMSKYYKVKNNKNSSSENFEENNFHKFKHNVKYTPPEKEIKFSDFILNKSHKLHMENRMKSYHERIATAKKKKEINPFELSNEIHLDSDFLKCLNNKNIKDESEKRLTLKDLKAVYNQKRFYGFLVFNMCIVLYLIFTI